MAADALYKFSEAVLTEAGDKRKELLAEIEKESKQRMSDKKKELERKKRKAIAAGEEKIRRNAALAVSGHRTELKKNLFASRAKLTEDVLGEVEKNIREFTLTEAYGAYLEQSLAVGSELFGRGETVCIARKEDIDRLKAMLGGKAVVFEEASEDIIGGFRLTNESLKLSADYTLAARLEEQRQWFCENSGMIIK